MRVETCQNVAENEKRLLSSPEAVTAAIKQAAQALFEEVQRMIKKDQNASIVICCSSTNNGADGAALADLLLQNGYTHTHIFHLGDTGKISLGAKPYFQKIKHKIIPYQPDTQAILSLKPDLIVDALLGFNARGALRELYIPMVEEINRTPCKVLSVDLPTGVDAQSGKVYGKAVQATNVVTFSTAKVPHFFADGKTLYETLVIKDIGLAIEPDTDSFTIPAQETLRSWLPKRIDNAHKYTYGTLGIVTTNPLMPGAALLNTRASMLTGIGLNIFLCRQENFPVLAAKAPDEALFRILQKPQDLNAALDKCTCVLFGSGMDKDPFNTQLLEILLDKDIKLVIDAGGFYHLKQLKDRITSKRAEIILTPHSAEAAFLLDQPVSAVTADPIQALRTLQETYHAGVNLKSNVMALRIQTENYLCPFGTNALAKAGSGDVLAGLTAGFFASGSSKTEAMVLAGYILQKASQSNRVDPYTSCATQIIEESKDVIKQLYKGTIQ